MNSTYELRSRSSGIPKKPQS